MNGIPRIRDVKPMNDNMELIVIFENNVKKRYDIKKLFDKYPIFEDLKTNSLFKLVHVDCGGYGISWNDKIDLSRYEIWNNGENV
ncbi:MAG: DUF2442 domain-containing protein [Peptococcales bacterium]|jgi:hypothetical protein